MTNDSFQPFSVGQYLCQERLRSEGAVGHQFSAVHLPTSNPCIIWQISLENMTAPEMIEVILHTLFRQQKISHPNIVPVHELIRKQLYLYIVKEHKPGATLQQVLTKLGETGPLPTQVASFIVWQMCQGLYYAHHLSSQGKPDPLVHGALWPANILLSYSGEVRLTHFGAWLFLKEENELSGTGLVVDPLRYVSPEFMRGEPPTKISDLFSIGALFYEMLTARPLFGDPVQIATLDHSARQEILALLNDIPDTLRPILSRCLEIDPSSRYADVAAFISELAVAVRGVGGESVREQLVEFLHDRLWQEDDEDTGSLPRPAPLPGFIAEEVTSISPADLTELLRDLSRELTDPGKKQEQQPRLTEASVSEVDHNEDTVVDSAALRPLSDPLLEEEEGTNSTTHVMSAPPLAALAGSASTGTEGAAQPSVSALFPSDDEELDQKTVEDKALLHKLRESDNEHGISPSPALGESTDSELNENLDDLTTNIAPLPLPKWEDPTAQLPLERVIPPADEHRSRPRAIVTGDEARSSTDTSASPLLEPPATALLQDALGETLPPLSLPHSFRETISTPVREDQVVVPHFAPVENRPPLPGPLRHRHPDSPTPPPAHDAHLLWLGPSTNESGMSRPGTPMEVSTIPRPSRWSSITGAHILLGVAILVFLVALSLLVRRLMLQHTSRPNKATVVLPQQKKHAAQPTRRDSGALATRDAQDTPDRSRSSGAHFKEVLSGTLQPGTLRIVSVPPGLAYVNHRTIGQTPATIQLPPEKEAIIHIEGPRYRLYQQIVHLPPDRGLEIVAHLGLASYPWARKRPRGFLFVRCRQRRDRRRLFLNGVDLGLSCPRAKFPLRPGRYKVGVYSVTKDKTWTYLARVRRNKRTYLWVPRER